EALGRRRPEGRDRVEDGGAQVRGRLLLRNHARPADHFAQAAEFLRAAGADPQVGGDPFRALAAQLPVHEGGELVLYFDTPHRLTPVPGLPARCRTATLDRRPDLKSTCLTSAAGEG